MALGDLYEFKLFSKYDSRIDMLNVFHYASLGSVDVTITMNQLAESFWNEIGDDVRAVICEQVVFTGVYVKKLGGVDEGFTALTSGNAGIIVGDMLPPWVCYSFKFQRSNTSTRHGRKRFSGVPESAQSAGVFNNSTIAPDLTTLANTMQSPLDADNGLNASAELWPQIVSFTLNGEPRVTPISSGVVAVSFVGLGSQNTRKT